MSYKEAYEKAKGEGSLETVVPDFFKWEEPGLSIVGRFKGRSEVTGQLSPEPYNQYIFETDLGLVKFSMGSATDKDAGQLMKVGEVYYVEFKGSDELTGGRKVNKFDILRLTDPSVEKVGGSDDIPF